MKLTKRNFLHKFMEKMPAANSFRPFSLFRIRPSPSPTGGRKCSMRDKKNIGGDEPRQRHLAARGRVQRDARPFVFI
jgi:hypothetical protein